MKGRRSVSLGPKGEKGESLLLLRMLLLWRGGWIRGRRQRLRLGGVRGKDLAVWTGLVCSEARSEC